MNLMVWFPTQGNSFLEDRKKRGEKYDADIEKYIDDYLVAMRYFSKWTTDDGLDVLELIFQRKSVRSTRK